MGPCVPLPCTLLRLSACPACRDHLYSVMLRGRGREEGEQGLKSLLLSEPSQLKSSLRTARLQTLTVPFESDPKFEHCSRMPEIILMPCAYPKEKCQVLMVYLKGHRMRNQEEQVLVWDLQPPSDRVTLKVPLISDHHCPLLQNRANGIFSKGDNEATKHM